MNKGIGAIRGLLQLASTSFKAIGSVRSLARIPHWEYHIRFDPKVGRKLPCRQVLDRFKRLDNGMWVKTKVARTKTRYVRKEPWLTESMYLHTCSEWENQMLDKLVSPYWQRRKHYIEDPYEPYHVRHGLKTPRLGKDRKMLRERRKILLDDTTSDRFFNDR